MNPETRDLLDYLHRQKHGTFPVARIDRRRYIARAFPPELPLILSLQAYPNYRRMVGENWMHWHDYYELFVALSGHGQWRCGNDRFPFSTGDIMLTAPLKIHGVVEMEASHTALVVQFRAEAVAPGSATLDRGFLSAWDRRPDRTLPRVQGEDPVAGAVHGAIFRLAQTWFEGGIPGSRLLALKFHFLEMLFHLSRAIVSRGQVKDELATVRSQRETRLRRALEFVSLHSHETISQPDVARAVGMSTSRFREFFKQTTGWGFAEHVRDIRLERAARQLRETSESVGSVALLTGFADQSHLQRWFKAKHGVSPLTYRKQHLERSGAGEIFKK